MEGVPDPFGLAGQVLDGQFRVDKYVGEGGFSVVYKGHHLGLSAPIAIKCLKLPVQLNGALVESFMHRFRDESRLYYQLSQGNLSIVRSISSGTTTIPATQGPLPYMVLEWLEGRSLGQDFELRRSKHIMGRSVDEVYELFSGAADGLGYAHAQGVVHRDMNPGNIFIVEDKGQTKTKVLDFGVAKILRDHTLELGARAQTLGAIRIFAPAYGAPEQFDDRVGEIGPWTDVYGLSLMILEALRDKTVMDGEHIGDFARQALDENKRPTPRALGLEVPDEIEQVFVRSFKINPKERWQNAADFWIVFRNAIKMARHKGFSASETVPLSAGFLKREVDKGKLAPQDAAQLNATLAMAPTPAVPPVAEHGPQAGGPQAGAPNTHRMSTERASTLPAPAMALNATLAMMHRPSALPPEASVPHVTPAAGKPATQPLAAVQVSQMAQPQLSPSPVAHSAVPHNPTPMAMKPMGGTLAFPSISMPQSATQPAAQPQNQQLQQQGMPAPTAPVMIDDPSASYANASPTSVAGVPKSGSGLIIGLAVVGGLVVLGILGTVIALVARSSHGPDTMPSASVSVVSSIPAIPSSVPSSAPSVDTSAAPSAAPSESAATEPPATPSANPTPDTTATAIATATATATATSTATGATTATSTATGTATAHPSASAAVDPNAFNEKTARKSLDTYTGMIVDCAEKDALSGPGNARITFAPDGSVSSVALDPPYATANAHQSACLTKMMSRAKTTPFMGGPATIRYGFTVPKP